MARWSHRAAICSGVNDLKVLLFGGTSEGRALAGWLRDEKIEHLVCVATQYGDSLLPEGVNVRVGRLNGDEMLEIMSGYDCVIDATHPYARVVTETIASASDLAGLTLMRLVRDGDVQGDWLEAPDTQTAAKMLEDLPGKILLTTGSKELQHYANLAHRAYPRVLPFMDSLQKCMDLSFPPKQIICMQGPFTQEMNEATIRQYGIDIVVTKLTGAAGGFWEKLDAARNCGCKALVIARPAHEQGFTLEEIKEKLLERM